MEVAIPCQEMSQEHEQEACLTYSQVAIVLVKRHEVHRHLSGDSTRLTSQLSVVLIAVYKNLLVGKSQDYGRKNRQRKGK